ncbi:MAG: response regulator transcription factor [Cyclobacteriaceae bacterium]
MRSKTVAIYDGQFLTRRGLVALIESFPEFELLFETNSIRFLKEKLCDEPSDIAVVSEDDPEVIKDLIAEEKLAKKLELVLIVGEKGKRQVKEFSSYGIKSILTEQCDEDEIKTALQAVSNGQRFFCSRVMDLMLDTSENESKGKLDELLSTREREVLELIVQGNSTASIAEKLFVSVHTVNTHRKNILKKLSLKSPTQLILYAIENGII